MFAKTANGSAKCLESYGLVSVGATVPPSNELWSEVDKWLAAGNSFADTALAYDNQLAAEQVDRESIQARNEYKEKRSELVNKIKITTTAGNQFDGDEVAQSRMARSIIGMNDDVVTINWVLATNTVASVNKPELQEALNLAGAEQARLWTLTMEQLELEP